MSAKSPPAVRASCRKSASQAASAATRWRRTAEPAITSSSVHASSSPALPAVPDFHRASSALRSRRAAE